jgi:5'-3' exonuclease
MTTNLPPQTFILCDSANLFHRAIHTVSPSAGIDAMIGMSLHLILHSLKKEWNTFNGSHAVIFHEGRSWRKSYYTQYKADRAVKYAAKTEKEKEEHTLLMEAYNDLITYFDTKTNMTVLQNPQAEADDMIATWISMHPNDNHVLISSDSDFYQLLAPNVKIYDPVKDILITTTSVTNDKGKNMSFILNNGKLSKLKVDPHFVPEPDWWRYALFLKIVRGDATDHIFSAYPGVREVGTKNKVGIKEAYNDRDTKGYNYCNFMLQRWVDHNGDEQRVKEVFERNRVLIDLTAQPDYIKEACELTVKEKVKTEPVVSAEIGMHFMKFSGRWDLKKISDSAQQFMPMLKSVYIKGAK